MWNNEFWPNSFWTDEYWPEGPVIPQVGGSQVGGRKRRNRILEHMYAEAERVHKQRVINEKIRRAAIMDARNRQETAMKAMGRRAAMALILAES